MIIKNKLKLLLACLILSQLASAQSTISGEMLYSKSKSDLNPNKSSDYPELDKYLTDYQLVSIPVRKNDVKISTKSPLLNLDLQERTYEMNLFQDNIMVRYDSEQKPLLLGGSLRNGGTVSLTINDDFIYGFIKEGGQTTYIEPLHYLVPDAPQGIYVTYDINSVIHNEEHVCGVDKTKQKAEELSGARTITTCKIIDLAIANTRDMITKYGSNTATENHNLAILNNVQTQYRSEFTYNVEFEVVAHYFPTSSNNDPLSPNTSTTNSSTLLSNFRNWARNGTQGGGNTGGAGGGFGVDYAMASFWTDRDITFNGSSGTVGLAYTPGWHHVLEDYTSTAASIAAMVTHEKGHNFGANHDASGSNYIMAPSVTITNNWSTASKNSIDSRLNSQTYLDNCSTLGAPTANFFQSAVAICINSPVVFEDQSQYGATRSWEFTNGSPATSTTEKPSVMYSTAGMHMVKITSTNASGTDIKLGYVFVQPAPPTMCTPNGGNGGSGGITGVTLNGMSNSSAATGLYEDFSCSSVATVDPGTAYNMVVGVTGGVTRLRYFIDYNDDGDFSDSGEASSLLSFSGSGNLGITMNTVSNPVIGELLRMRVIVSTSSIASDGCTVPSTGQVEDYSIYFEIPPVYGCTDPAATNYDPNATIDDGSCTYPGNSTTWYRDADNDGYGNPNNSTTATSQPSGFISDNTDCNDNNPNVNPGATEVCDGLDNNCNGQTDEGVTNTYYRDLDNDGYGHASISTQACSAPSGYVTNNSDCNDNNPNVNPGASEVCDNLDNNCNGQVDEGVRNTYYRDLDGDGYGNPNVTNQACSAPTGYVSNNLDCNDSNGGIYPGATELCDNMDNNCNGQIDEGLPQLTYYVDNDGDGFGNPNNSAQSCYQPSGYVLNNLDCNDNNANVNPAATEVCDNIDNNCNGVTDEGCTSGPSCDGTVLVINTVTQNIYRAQISITSYASVSGNNNILFAAGNSIELKPGFEVILGTDFEARIESCNNFAPGGSGSSNNMVELGDLNEQVAENFPPASEVHVQVYNSKKSSVERTITTDKLQLFLETMSLNMEKGSYKLKISNDNSEMIQEIFIIN